MRVFRGRVVSASAVVVALLLGGSFARADEAGGEKVLTDRDKEHAGDKDVGAMRHVLAAVDKLVEEARNEKDTLRLNCINERKAQMSGLLKVAELSLEDLRAAMTQRQEEVVDQEFDKISLAKKKVVSFKTEAEQCIGSLKFYDSNKTEVEVTQPADLPNEDTISPEPVATPFFRPPPASPLR